MEGGSLGGGAAAASPEAELAARMNEMWFLEPGGEPLTFREVFLRSQALENILLGAPFPAQALLSFTACSSRQRWGVMSRHAGPYCAAHTLRHITVLVHMCS